MKLRTLSKYPAVLELHSLQGINRPVKRPRLSLPCLRTAGGLQRRAWERLRTGWFAKRACACQRPSSSRRSGNQTAGAASGKFTDETRHSGYYSEQQKKDLLDLTSERSQGDAFFNVKFLRMRHAQLAAGSFHLQFLKCSTFLCLYSHLGMLHTRFKGWGSRKETLHLKDAACLWDLQQVIWASIRKAISKEAEDPLADLKRCRW